MDWMVPAVGRNLGLQDLPPWLARGCMRQGYENVLDRSRCLTFLAKSR